MTELTMTINMWYGAIANFFSSFTSGLAGGHLFHLYSTFLDNLHWNNISLYEKTAALGICWHFVIQVAKIQTF